MGISTSKRSVSTALILDNAITDAKVAAHTTTKITVPLATQVSGTLPTANGGTGETTIQAAIDSLSDVSSATNEHVLTKDTGTGNAVFKAIPGGVTLPVVDTTSIAEGSIDATKEVRFEVDGLTTGTTRVITMADENIDLGANQTKLDGIETSAKDDLTGAEIKALYEVVTNAFTDTLKTKLDGIETSATADQTDAEIETAYNAQVTAMSQAQAEAGTNTVIQRVTAQRIKQAIDALGGGGGGNSFFITGQLFSQSATSTEFVSLDTDIGFGPTENEHTDYIPIAITWSNLSIHVTAHSYTGGNSALQSRDDGADGNQTVTPTGTGDFEDVSNTDTVVANSLINYQAGGSGATGGSATYRTMSVSNA